MQAVRFWKNSSRNWCENTSQQVERWPEQQSIERSRRQTASLLDRPGLAGSAGLAQWSAVCGRRTSTIGTLALTPSMVRHRKRNFLLRSLPAANSYAHPAPCLRRMAGASPRVKGFMYPRPGHA